MSRLRKIKERKQEFLRAIEFTKQRKRQVESSLESKPRKEWMDYYDKYLNYYRRQVNLCDKLARAEDHKRVKKIIFLLVILIVIIGAILTLLFFVLKPELIDFFTGPEVQRVIERAEIPVNLEQGQVLEESLVQYPATVGKPVRWKKTFTTNTASGFSLELPPGSENIKIEKIKPEREDITSLSEIKEKGILRKRVEISVEEQGTEYSVEFETPAPEILEQQVGNKKIVTIIAPENMYYENILAPIEIQETLKRGEQRKIKVYQVKEEDGKEIKEKIPFSAYDSDENGLLDSIELIGETRAVYEIIIEISKAEHLDESRQFISDIYNQVSQLDNIWSEEISEQHYIRITFKSPLDNTRDITLYPRVVEGEPRIQVYELEGSEIVAEFTSLSSNEYNKVFLTNLQNLQDTFDLLVLGGTIEIDHIIDPYALGLLGSFNTTTEFNAWNVVGDNANGGYSHDTRTYFAGGGSLTGQSAAGDGISWFGEAMNLSTLPIESGLPVFLNLSIRKGSRVRSPVYHNMTVALIKPSGALFYIWEDSSLTENTWLSSSTDVSSFFDETGVYQVRLGCDMINGAHKNALTQCWFDEVTLDVRTITDNTPPTINLNNPINNELFTYANITFNCSASDNINLKNITLYGNWSGSWQANQTIGISGLQNETIFQVNISDGTYSWNCYACDDSDNCAYSVGNYTFTINTSYAPPQPPQITYITPIPAKDPTENSYTSVQFKVTMYDANGVGDLNHTSVTANFTRPGEATRQNLSCINITGEATATSQNYSCTIDMWYWDESGDWNITVYGEDISGASAINYSAVFYYNSLQAMMPSPPLITWPTVTQGNLNQTPSEYLLINNTGNQEGVVAVTAINLYGEDIITEFIGVENISVSSFTSAPPAPVECNASATTLLNGNSEQISDSFLGRGNLSAGQAQEQLYYCIREVPFVLTQTYSTKQAGSWTITILIAAVVVKTNKRKKRKRKSIKDDNSVKALNLLARELRGEYSKEKQRIINLLIKQIKKRYRINNKELAGLVEVRRKLEIPLSIFSKKLEALESISKYMKENLNMNYHEIASFLARDDRTIWTVYNRTKKKHSPAIKIKEGMVLPISIFKEKLTILESIVLFLKNRKMRYVEIAKLLSRDQRNIWAIYSRAEKKIKRKV